MNLMRPAGSTNQVVGKAGLYQLLSAELALVATAADGTLGTEEPLR
jgi:hypothetical protein